jgi:mxaA protein
MRLLGRKDADAASRSLHHAFNRCAGRVVINSELDKLWQQCPWLEALKADIESFYHASAAHYFSPSAAEQKDFEEILKLAKACRERERLA